MSQSNNGVKLSKWANNSFNQTREQLRFLEVYQTPYLSPRWLLNWSAGWLTLALAARRKFETKHHVRGPFHPLVDLLKSGLCYLEEDWDGLLYESAMTLNDPKQIQVAGKRRDINVVRSEEHQGALWLEVELLGPGHCEREDPEVVAKGWVPAHKKDGKPHVWFYSRGC